MALRDFDETHPLSVTELRAILASDDAPSRVYAVWALGLRAVRARQLAEQLVGEPDAGVRRALAVVLAGDGEIDLLLALARHGPNVHVRASASTLVVRFATSGHVPWTVIAERLADRPEVQAAILGEVDASAPAEIHALVARCLEHEDGSVRREAFQCAVKLHDAGAGDDESVCRYLEGANVDEARLALEFWFEAATPRTASLVLARASRAVREIALRMRPHLAFTDLVALIEQDAALLLLLEYQLPPIEAAPLPLVAPGASRRGQCQGPRAIRQRGFDTPGERPPPGTGASVSPGHAPSHV